MAVALFSAATFATSGPFAKSLLEAGWTPGSVVLLRIAGAALLLAVPTVRALGGRWGDLARQWRRVVTYGVSAVALPQLAFFYAVQHLSVGVALLLEYLALVLVVAWQALVGRRLPGRATWLGIALAVTGLVLVLDVFGGVHVDGVGVLWGLLAALGLTSYFVASGHVADDALPPIALAGGGLACAAVGFAVLGLTRVLPMSFPTGDVVARRARAALVGRRGRAGRVRGRGRLRRGHRGHAPAGADPGLVRGSVRGALRGALRLAAARRLPRPVQLVGGLFILAGVVVVRAEGRGSQAEHGPTLGTTPLGEVAEVADDRVDLPRVDVATP